MLNLQVPSPPFPTIPTPIINTAAQNAYLGMPVGSIISFAGKILEEEGKKGKYETDLQHFNWKVCDGSSLQSDEYPHLFNALGYLYGGSDNSFNLPNLEGTFLRGVGKDDASTEKRKNAKGKSSKEVGSTQGFALQTHQHQYDKPTGAGPGDSGSAFAATETTLTSKPTDKKSSVPGNVVTSEKETRPVNIFVYFLIKCKPDDIQSYERVINTNVS